MDYIVSITSQGQVSIPRRVLRDMEINIPAKAILRKRDNSLEIEPRKDFWSLGGSLNTGIRLSQSDLRRAREEYGKSIAGEWDSK